MREKRNDKKFNQQNNYILNIFLYIFLVLCIVLTTTLYFYYKINSVNSDELFLVKDIHKLKAHFKDAHFIHINSLDNKQNSPKILNTSKNFFKSN
jgi:hypothetical protein